MKGTTSVIMNIHDCNFFKFFFYSFILNNYFGKNMNKNVIVYLWKYTKNYCGLLIYFK